MSKRHYCRLISLIVWLVFPIAALCGTLSDVPLNLKATVPPNVLFALSVEYPTADTAAYQGASDYSPANQYLGLFDQNKCYLYDTTNFWFYAPSSTLATNHVCGSSYWSGNFLNWATMTGLDEFRYAMTGGNRYQDTQTLTVLERTYIDTQGGTTDYKDKTFNLSSSNFQGALPFSLNTVTGTISNQSKGVKMLVTATTPTTIRCTAYNMANGVTYHNCTTFTMDFNPNNSTIKCTHWVTTANKVCDTFSSTNTGETITVSGTGYCTATTTSTTPNPPAQSGHCMTYTATYSASPYSGSQYYVRVKVCDPTVGLESNCTQYGTSYKPTGVLQQNGDKMRFGVFSYYNSTDIDNAVMRSKLKYIAPQQYASAIGTVVNANKEWSETNGTLIANPDPTIASGSYHGAVSNSGVINYINEFGTVSQRYKQYDNVSKLYYEALAYLRFRPADSTFYGGVTTANAATTNDGFPVIVWDNTITADDPIIYACQKNYIITMGDSHTHCDKRLPGGTYTSTQNSCSWCPSDYSSLNNGDTLNATTWTNKLGNLESKTSFATTITGAGCASYYISGLAYYAKVTDIRPDDATKANTLGPQTVKTFVIDVQESADQGMYSQYWYAAKYGGSDSVDAAGNPIGWTTDSSPTSASWPKTLLPAGNPLAMITAVQSAFQSIQAGIDVDTALAQSSGDLRTAGGAYIYQAIFNAGGWIGDVLAYAVDNTGNVSNTASWSASSWFASHTPNDRHIFSFNDGLKTDGTADSTNLNARLGISLPQASLTSTNFTSLFSNRQQALLNTNSQGVTDNQGLARINYMRGETTNEGTAGLQWRARSGKIGDIVDSTPEYVGAPLPGLVGPGYSTFQQTYANRKPMLYAGANDGFLHAFDASPPGTSGATPGEELMAYIPGAVYTNLSQLMTPSYPHKFFVDGNPIASEACFGSCPANGSGWKTVLAGGYNAGGQGIYALNVTNPSGFATVTGPNLVLWEFTDRDDADLGYTFGNPIIKKMNNNKWAVIFGNGYNNTVSDGKVSTTGRAYLYIVYVDGPTGTGKTWTPNTDYYKIEFKTTGEPATLPNNPPNGLSGPVGIDKNLDGTVDLIYAGDRFGNVWKVDVSSATPSSWGVGFGSTASPKPLFSAKDSSGLAQQITSSLDVSRHPQGGYLVYFGTGSYLDTTDTLPDNGTSFNTQTVYGIWDKDNLTSTQKANFTTLTRSQLQGQSVLATVTSGGDTFYIQSNCAPNYATATANTYQLKSDGTTADYDNCPSTIAKSSVSQQSGWFFDLPGTGERVVADHPMVGGGIVTFSTLTPATNPCTGDTVGRMYDLDYLSGGRVSRGGGGVFDLNNDKKIDSSDKFAVTALGGVSSNASTWIAPSGKLLISGASDTPIRMRLADGVITLGSGGGSTTSTTTTTGGCSDFVSGWGCQSGMGRKSLGASFMDYVSNQNLAGNGLLPTGNNIDATQVELFVPSGRVSWREIMR